MQTLNFNFNSEKTLQAICFLLNRHYKCMDVMRLQKLLYITDKELLLESGMVLTGDIVFFGTTGLFLSQIYTDLCSSVWIKNILKDGHQIVLSSDYSDVGRLTKREISKLEEVSERYKYCSCEKLADLIKDFKEFKILDSVAVGWEEVLKLENQEDLILEIKEMIDRKNKTDAFFNNPDIWEKQ